jgi:hypothetical protein
VITPHRLVRFVRREELFAQLEGTCGAEWQQAASGQWPMGGCEMTNGYCAWVYKNNGSYNIIKYMYTLRIYIYNICILYIYMIKSPRTITYCKKSRIIQVQGLFLVHFPVGDSEVLLGFCLVVPVSASSRSFNRG